MCTASAPVVTGTITVSGGTVTATGGIGGAGIGGGYKGAGGYVTINGGNTEVTAQGREHAHDIGSGWVGTGGGTLSVAGTNLNNGPQVKLQSHGINAAKPDGTSHQFVNCKIWGAAAKSTGNHDISGCYDTNGKIWLTAALSAAAKDPDSTASGSPLTLTANVTRTDFGDSPTLFGRLSFLCGGNAIGNPVSIVNGVATTDWTPADTAQHQLTALYQPDDGEIYVTDPADIMPLSYPIPIKHDPKKITPVVSALPTASSVSVGDTLSASTLRGGIIKANESTVLGTFAWAHPDTVVTASGNYDAVFTPNDGTNYKQASVSVPVTITAPSEGNSTVTPTPDLRRDGRRVQRAGRPFWRDDAVGSNQRHAFSGPGGGNRHPDNGNDEHDSNGTGGDGRRTRPAGIGGSSSCRFRSGAEYHRHSGSI